jgi:uncharacterized membrane protein YqjE
MRQEGPGRRGLLGSLRGFLATLLGLAHTRLALASAELEETLERLAEMLLWSAVALTLGVLALVLLALTVVIAFWDEHRLLAAGGVTLIASLAAGAAAWRVRGLAAERPRLLSDTLDELQRDIEVLEEEP